MDPINCTCNMDYNCQSCKKMEEIDRFESALVEGFNPNFWKDVPVHCKKCGELSDETHPSDELCPECHISENVDYNVLDDFDCQTYSMDNDNEDYHETELYDSDDDFQINNFRDNDVDSIPEEIFEMYYGECSSE